MVRTLPPHNHRTHFTLYPGFILCYNVTSIDSFKFLLFMLDTACTHEPGPGVYGLVVGIRPPDFCEEQRVYALSHCEHVCHMHNVHHFEVDLASSSPQQAIRKPFDAMAQLCTRNLVRRWKEVPLDEVNTFRFSNFEWSPGTHRYFCSEFRRFVVLLILNTNAPPSLTHRQSRHLQVGLPISTLQGTLSLFCC